MRWRRALIGAGAGLVVGLVSGAINDVWSQWAWDEHYLIANIAFTLSVCLPFILAGAAFGAFAFGQRRT